MNYNTASIADQRNAARDRRAFFQLESDVRDAGRKLNLNAEQVADLIMRARREFAITDGVARAMRPDRLDALRNQHGWPVSIEEWAVQTISPPDPAMASIPASPARNPFRRETWNVTEQMKLQRRDPELAARLKLEV